MSQRTGCARILLGEGGKPWPAVVVDHRGVRLFRSSDGIWKWLAAETNKTLDIRWFFWRLDEHEIGLLSDRNLSPIADKILMRAIDGLFEDNELAEYRRRLRRAA